MPGSRHVAAMPGPLASLTIAAVLVAALPTAAAEPTAAIAALVRAEARRHGLDEGLVFAVMRLESNFQHRAVSLKGAMGLMQLMPATAKRFGVRDPWDPAQNIRGGCAYLRFLLDRFDGNLRLALAAYNAGEGAVDAFGGVPPYAETRRYVAALMGGSAGSGRAVTAAGRVVEWQERPTGDRGGLFARPSVAGRQGGD